MATLVLGGIGAGLGFLAGGPAGAALGFNVGALVGGLVFAHPQDQSFGKLDDLRVTGSSYGSTIPTVYGAGRVGGTIIWATDLVEHSHDQHPGKGGGPSVRNYTYTCSFAVSVCRGPIYGIKRIWAEDLLIYDSTHNPPTQYNIHTPYLGTETQTQDSLMSSILGADKTPAFRGQAYVVFENLELTNWGNRLPSFSFEIDVDPAVTWRTKDVLTDLAGQCGLQVADYDFTDATDPITGMSSTQRSPAYSIAESMLHAYSTDMVEIDGKLVAVRRGAASAGFVPASDMGAHDWQGPENEPPPRSESIRTSDLSLPFRIDFGYASYDRIYEQSMQSAVKHSRQQVQDQKTVQSALTMKDVDANNVANMMLDLEWLERTTHSFSVGLKWLLICPATAFTAEIGPYTIRVRATQVDISPLGQIAVQAVTDASTSASTGDIGGYRGQASSSNYIPSSMQTAVAAPSPTSFDLYSGPEFRDEDGLSPGFYVAATGTDGWTGGMIYYSSDSGAHWTQGGVVTSRADFGSTTSVLPDGTTHNAIDTTSSLGVQLVANGSLITVSPADVVNGLNAALIGAEITGFQNVATGTGDLAFTLTNITRGRRNSTMTGHVNPERFWHLNSSIARVAVDKSLIGTSIQVKVLSPGQALTDVVAQSVMIYANNYPYATPADLAGLGGTPSGSATDVASAGAAGTATTYSRGDHTHRGVHSLAKSGATPLYGDVTLTGTGGIALTESGNNIAIDGSGITGGGGTANGNIGGYQSTGVSAITHGNIQVYIYNAGISSNQSMTLPQLIVTGTKEINYFTFVNASAFTLTLTADVTPTNTIDGLASIVVGPGETITLASVGADSLADGIWHIVASRPWIMSIKITSGSSYAPVLGDAGKVIEHGNSAGGPGVGVVIPTNASVPFAVGTIIRFVQIGTDALHFSTAGGVTLHSRGGLTSTNGQYAEVHLRKSATNTWTLSGDIA